MEFEEVLRGILNKSATLCWKEWSKHSKTMDEWSVLSKKMFEQELIKSFPAKDINALKIPSKFNDSFAIRDPQMFKVSKQAGYHSSSSKSGIKSTEKIEPEKLIHEDQSASENLREKIEKLGYPGCKLMAEMEVKLDCEWNLKCCKISEDASNEQNHQFQ